MAKRARSTLPSLDQLTGGSQDVNPQYFVCSLQMPSSTVENLVLSNSVTIPVPPVGLASQNMVQVPELLDISRAIYGYNVLLTQFVNNTNAWFLTRLTMGSSPDNAGTFTTPNVPSNRTLSEFLIEGGNGTLTIGNSSQSSGVGDNGGALAGCNLTDNAGHGVVLYGNTLTLSAQSKTLNFPAKTTTVIYWIKYRIKNVTLADYVQGQAALLGNQTS